MDRFLRYSLEHGRSIRAVFLLEGGLTQKTITVLAMEAGIVTLRVGTKKQPMQLPWQDILSCDYARGDHGDK